MMLLQIGLNVRLTRWLAIVMFAVPGGMVELKNVATPVWPADVLLAGIGLPAPTWDDSAHFT